MSLSCARWIINRKLSDVMIANSDVMIANSAHLGETFDHFDSCSVPSALNQGVLSQIFQL